MVRGLDARDRAGRCALPRRGLCGRGERVSIGWLSSQTRFDGQSVLLGSLGDQCLERFAHLVVGCRIMLTLELTPFLDDRLDLAIHRSLPVVTGPVGRESNQVE